MAMRKSHKDFWHMERLQTALNSMTLAIHLTRDIKQLKQTSACYWYKLCSIIHHKPLRHCR